MIILNKNNNDRSLEQLPFLKASALTTDRCKQCFIPTLMERFNYLIYGCFFLTLISCTLDFSEKDQKWLLYYDIGDTLIFKNNIGDIDTFSISARGTRQIPFRLPGMDQPGTKIYKPKEGTIWYNLKTEKYNWVSFNCSSQSFIKIYKSGRFKKASVSINFIDFWTINERKFQSKYKGKLFIDNIKIDDITTFQPYGNFKVKDTREIKQIYWSEKYGLIRYDRYNGEIWELANLD